MWMEDWLWLRKGVRQTNTTRNVKYDAEQLEYAFVSAGRTRPHFTLLCRYILRGRQPLNVDSKERRSLGMGKDG